MLNKVTLIGRLGETAEIRYSAGGTAVCNISLATSRRWKDKQSGEKKEETEWHRVVFFTRLAEVSAEYLKKGSLIYVEGRIRTRKWNDEAGVVRYSTEILGDMMQMLDSKSDHSVPEHTDSPAPPPKASPSSLDDFDDVPF